jgi:hypothetical protein
MGLFQDSSDLTIPNGTFSEVHGDMHYSHNSTNVSNMYFFGSEGVQVVKLQELIASAMAGIVLTDAPAAARSDDQKTQDPKIVADGDHYARNDAKMIPG